MKMPATRKTKAAKAPKVVQPVETAVAAQREAVETVVKAGQDAASKGYEKAVAMTQEQVEAATKNYEKAVAATKEQVETVVKVGADAFKGYEDFAAFGKENVEAVVKSSSILAKGAQDVNKVLFGLAQGSVEASVAAAKAILGCKTLRDVVEVQSEYAKVNFGKYLNEGRKVSDLSVRVLEDAMAPIGNRVNVAVEKISKPIAA
jgi:phasin family protein